MAILERSHLEIVRAVDQHGFPVITRSLGISRWKNMQQINDCGHRAAAPYPGLTYWDNKWRKGGGSQRMIETSKRERFYQQAYCGCIYPLRDTNKRRVANGRQRIKLGVLYCGMHGASCITTRRDADDGPGTDKR